MEEEDVYAKEEDEDREDDDGDFECTECDKTFSSASRLKSHIRVHSGQNLFGCKKCPAKFVYANQLKLHSKIHEGNGAYACPKCPAKFTLAWRLKLHEKTHVKKKVFSCSECSAKFDSADGLRDHQLSHSMPYVCMLCEARFSTARNLWDHEKIHTDDEAAGSNSDGPAEALVTTTQNNNKETAKKTLHRCVKCGLRFASKDLLKRHTCVKTRAEKSFCCSHCSAKFGKRENLIEHERKHTQKSNSKGSVSASKDSPSVIEEVIDLTDEPADGTKQDSSTKKREKSHSDVKAFSCPECPAKFITFVEKRGHMMSHGHKEKAHSCSQCSAKFADYSSLESHQKTHQQAKGNGYHMYKCPECPVIVKKRTHLESHMLVHTSSGEDRPFKCQYCSASYKLKNSLTCHLKLHNEVEEDSRLSPTEVTLGEIQDKQGGAKTSKKRKRDPQEMARPSPAQHPDNKSYSCNECPAKFTSSHHLWSHMRVHLSGTNEDKPYRCTLCTAKFSTANHLTKHFKVHKDKPSTGDNTFSQGVEAAPEKPVSVKKQKKQMHNDSGMGNSFLQGEESTPEKTPKKQKKRQANVRYRCSLCTAEFLRPYSLKIHWRTHTGEKPYSCPKCPASFSRPDHLQSHLKIHKVTKKGQHSCPYCLARFDRISRLTNHLKIHGEEDTTSCSSTPAESIASKRAFKCSDCPASFTCKGNLTVHQRVHTSPYVCPECPAAFGRPDHLKTHLLVHSSDGVKSRPYGCHHCSAKFSGFSSLSYHLKLHAKESGTTSAPCQKKPDTTYNKCPHCLRQFATKKAFKSHSKKCLLAVGSRAKSFSPPYYRYCRPHSCPHCRAKFALASTLEKHMKTHRSVEPEEDQQDAASASSSTTSQPRSAGDVERRFCCGECPAKFSRGSHLKKHWEIHDVSKPKPYSCSYCTAKFTSASHLVKHVKMHDEGDAPPQSAMEQGLPNAVKRKDGRGPYHCTVCSATFTKEMYLKSHKRLHSKENQGRSSSNKCPAFAQKKDLEGHKEIHAACDQESPTPESPISSSKDVRSHMKKKVEWFSCQYCKAQFKGVSRLEVHVNVHHWEELQNSASPPAAEAASEDGLENKTYKCPHCPAKFSKAQSVKTHQRIHQRIHQRSKSYKCKKCSATYATSKSLNVHRVLTHGESPYGCPYCPERFKQWPARQSHVALHDKEATDPHCAARFPHKSGLETHEKIHSKQKPYACSKCPARFSTKANLRRHSWKHTGVKRFRCSQCPAKFHRSDERDSHEWRHMLTGDSETLSMTFKCKKCSSKFSRAEDLREHEKSHAEKQPTTSKATSSSMAQEHGADKRAAPADRQHVCQKCSRKFLSQEQLEYHMVWHSAEKRHECTLCSQTFPTAQSLKEHRKTHAGERPYRCPLCPSDFERRSNLKRHVETKHSEESEQASRTSSDGKTGTASKNKKIPQHTEGNNSPGSNRNHPKHQKTISVRAEKVGEKHKESRTAGKKSSTQKRPKCPVCNKTLSAFRHLERHMKIHTREKPFHCPKCSLRFARRDLLQWHLANEHAGTQPTSPPELEQNKRRSPCKKVYNCPECPSRFSNPELLARHKNIHTSQGKRPPNNNPSSTTTPDLPTLDVMETQVVHQPGAASHIETVVVANLSKLPEPEDSSAVQKVSEIDESQPSEALESSASGQPPETHHPSVTGSSAAAVHPQVTTTPVLASMLASSSNQASTASCTFKEQVQTKAPTQTTAAPCPSTGSGPLFPGPLVAKKAATRVSPLFAQHLPLQETNEKVKVLVPSNGPLLAGLWQKTGTTSPPQGVVPVALSCMYGEVILQAAVANSYCGETSTVLHKPGMLSSPQGMGEVTGRNTSNMSADLSTMSHVSSACGANQQSIQQTGLSQGNLIFDQNGERRMGNMQKSEEGKSSDVRLFCIGCKQVFATEQDLKDHLGGDSSGHKIVALQKKSMGQEKTTACSEANVLSVPKQGVGRILRNCSHVFCVLCAGKVNINDLSHHVKIKHGMYMSDGTYPFGQATSCMTCSRRLYSKEDIQQHTSQRHTVLRDTAGPFLAYDNTKTLTDEGSVTPFSSSTSGQNDSADVSGPFEVKLYNRMTAIAAVNSPPEVASVHETFRTNNRAVSFSAGLLSSKEALKRKFLMVSRAAEALAKKKRYLVIRGSDGTDRSDCSSPPTDCSSTHTTTSSPPLAFSEQPAHVFGTRKEGEEELNDSASVPAQPSLTSESQNTSGLREKLALVASVLSATFTGKSSTVQNPETGEHRRTVNTSVTKPTVKTWGPRGCLSNVVIKTEPVTCDVVDSAEASPTASDMEDLGDVSAINEPLMSIKEEATIDDY